MQKILIVEDDRDLNASLSYALEKQKYSVASVFSISQAKKIYVKEAPHLVLMDINLPDGEGFELCRWMKSQKDVPVLFLTARDMEEDVLSGYDLGAEDYVTKPFSMKILLRKIEVILKRTPKADSIGHADFDDGYLKIDLNNAKVSINGKKCSVTPTELRLLREFIRNQGQLLTYNILLERLWDTGGQFVDKHALAVNVNRLRGKLEDEQHKYISNVYGMGYQWIG
ncbi:response regulator [Lachnospiraceae bacterium WCA-9-b2]|uniref:Stage 0 sporulation protein A homolog n=1 Tax=Sporofaciens musculi TaxID=2681861 RepID=A0A7X3ML79_9FIRM|nr:response regulator transcription factor [Sporofaciens musculi]MCI9421259.1 response regulator transcription factor [Dorea sp.]MXP78499.1 response regulator [Sporofaciens musculi]